MFEVGKKVVCIADSWKWLDGLEGTWSGAEPVKDEIYVIVEIHEHNGKVFLELDGFPNNLYCSTKFRNLDYGFVEEVLRLINERPVEIA